jgi:hypothetical protein
MTDVRVQKVLMVLLLAGLLVLPAMADPVVIYDGDVTLANAQYSQWAYKVLPGAWINVPERTPLGALHAVSLIQGFAYDVSNKKSPALLLDNIYDPSGAWAYRYDAPTGHKWAWTCMVNGVVLNELSGSPTYPSALNHLALDEGDVVIFYYGDTLISGYSISDATAKIVIRVNFGATPTDWSLNLIGARTQPVTKGYFEQALLEHSSHKATWTDGTGNVWEGMPLWLLVGMVDDNPDVGPEHFNFNDDLATQGYQVKVISSNGDYKVFDSADIARNNNYIVANTLNGETLPLQTSDNKPSWPLFLKGSGVPAGQQVGGIIGIELLNLPQPPPVIPKVTISRVDASGNVLDSYILDYNEMQSKFSTLGDDQPYQFQGPVLESEWLKVYPTLDGYDWWDPQETVNLAKVSEVIKATSVKDLLSLIGGMSENEEVHFLATDNRDLVLYANNVNNPENCGGRQGTLAIAWWNQRQGYVTPLTDGYRLFFLTPDQVFGATDMRLCVDPSLWHYNQGYPSAAGLSQKYIDRIQIRPRKPEWNLELDGTRVGGVEASIVKGYFDQALTCQFGAHHGVDYFDSSNNKWNGMPLWFLAGYVDDADQHSPNAYNGDLAQAGYDIVIIGGKTKVFDSVPTIRSNEYIVANTKNDVLFDESSTDYPLKLVGAGVSSSEDLQVGGIQKIVLNLRPVLKSLTVPTAPVLTAASATATASFTDPYDIDTAVFNWGDGMTSNGVLGGASTFTGTHAYAKPGFYTVKVTLQDSMGAQATATSSTQVIVYDPKSGFVTGIGSITSPAGAYAASPSLTGDATIELLARYPVFINKPFTGVTAFQFPKAKVIFTSMSYDWLVIQKDVKKAFYKGSGKITGKGDYAFLISVIDGGSKPAQDKIRIKIWNKATGAVIYDTQPNAADNADPTTPLTRGGLVIDKL